ncbi:hypothetical protein SAMN04488514_109125 [Kriegella aquimaris]|uniref:Uncharacterized protein n=1 Tax=Kriegella aquimaris TaxID=192904 RepID=A0A1G9TM75_9FLAO|nr:hypothetical protein SAMN04488514_109125 [Kriegella aquimaris]
MIDSHWQIGSLKLFMPEFIIKINSYRLHSLHGTDKAYNLLAIYGLDNILPVAI